MKISKTQEPEISQKPQNKTSSARIPPIILIIVPDSHETGRAELLLCFHQVPRKKHSIIYGTLVNFPNISQLLKAFLSVRIEGID
jgi:hypothetical protein